MPRHEYVLTQHIEKYLEKLRVREKARKETVDEYRRLIRHAMNAWYDADMNWSPKTVGEEEIYFLQNEAWAHLRPDVARRQIAIIGTFLKRMGKNPVVENMNLEWPESMRLNVKWLEPMQALALMKAAVGMERILVHCELCLCMRRIEVKRAHVGDFKDGRVEIMGKGRQGGKPRTIPWHPRTFEELSYYQSLREETVAGYPVAPESLLVYERGGQLGAYQDTAIDRMIKSASVRAGLDPAEVSNHVLRRTGARLLKYAGTPTITIMQILGHKTEEQTLAYIGWGLDEMRSGMQMYGAYLQQLEKGNVPVSGTKRG